MLKHMEASEVIFKSMVEGELTRRVVMGKFRGPFQAPVQILLVACPTAEAAGNYLLPSIPSTLLP